MKIIIILVSLLTVFSIIFTVVYAVNLHPKGTFDSENFRLTNMTGNYIANEFTILGIIDNVGNKTFNNVFLYVMQYDAKNNLIGLNQGNALLDITTPDSSSPLKISFYPNKTGFDHYVVKAAVS